MREREREIESIILVQKKYFVCIALLHMCAQQKDLIIYNVAKHFSKESFYMCLSENDGQKNVFKVAHDFCS